MTQLIVTLDNAVHLSIISKAISLLKGVVDVSVNEQPTKDTAKPMGACLDPELKSIMGIASSLKGIEADGDERFSYIMGK